MADELTTVHTELGNGTQFIRDDAAATGMNCAHYIGRIAALRFALEILQEVEDQMFGAKGE